MNLKEAVEEVIESAMIDGWHSMEPGASLWQHNVQQQTRAAITAMREALLQPEVVEAAAKYMYVDGGNQGVWEEERETYQNRYRGRAETTLEVALAALQHDDAPVDTD